VKALVLIAPAATFVPLSQEFFIRGILGGSLSGALNLDWPVYSMIRWMTTMRPVNGLEVVEQFRVGLKNLAPLQPGLPEVFTAEEFSRLKMPVLLVIGDHEVVYSRRPQRVVEEARKVLPGIQIAFIADGGHAVSIDQAEATNKALCDFLLPLPSKKIVG
jgi:pimeloyl-ACP methyl ester carboxylesterase